MATIDTRTEKTSVAADDMFLISDSADADSSKKVKGSNLLKASTNISGLTEKTSAVDADLFVINDSANSNASRKLTFANLKFYTKNSAITTQTGAYGAIITDDLILCNGTFTVTLPASSTATGVLLTIKNTGTGTITIDGNASETIDGATTFTLLNQYEAVRIICDGSNWHVV